MVDVIIQGMWVLNGFDKDEDNESLPLLAFQGDVVDAIFLKYSKEGILSSNHVGIRNIVFYQMFAMMTQNITWCNLRTVVFTTYSNI